MKESFRVAGYVKVGNSESDAVNRAAVSNQVSYDGIKSILAALADVKSVKITNMFLLSGFKLPEGITDIRELKFEDIKDYIAFQAFTGNNQQVNADGTVDMRVYTSNNPPYETSFICTIPVDKANQENVFNACCLIVDGDEMQSVSNSDGNYVPTGNEKIFSIAMFTNEVVKENYNDFVVMWYIQVN